MRHRHAIAGSRVHRISRWWWAPVMVAAFLLGWIGAELATDEPSAAAGGVRAASAAADTNARTSADPSIPGERASGPPAASHAFDRRYTTRDGVALGYDVRWPDSGRDLPAVVLLHGGGWWSGDKQDPLVVSVAMTLQRAGFVVVSANYRLACGNAASPRTVGTYDYASASPLCGATVPVQVADVVDLLAHVRTERRALRIDARRVALMGMSAGGHLALLASTVPADVPVRAVVNWSGPPATEFIARQPMASTGRHDHTIRPAFINAIGCERADCPNRWRRASPIDQVVGASPSMAILSLAGERETQVPFAELAAFHERLDELRIENSLYAGAGICHGAGCATLLLPQGTSTALDASIEFLQNSLRAPARAG